MKSGKRATRCLFCKTHSNLTIHHNYLYDFVRDFLKLEHGDAGSDNSHEKRQEEIIRINHEGGIVPMCVRHHEAWERFLRGGKVGNKNWKATVKKIIERNIRRREDEQTIDVGK